MFQLEHKLYEGLKVYLKWKIFIEIFLNNHRLTTGKHRPGFVCALRVTPQVKDVFKKKKNHFFFLLQFNFSFQYIWILFFNFLKYLASNFQPE